MALSTSILSTTIALLLILPSKVVAHNVPCVRPSSACSDTAVTASDISITDLAGNVTKLNFSVATSKSLTSIVFFYSSSNRECVTAEADCEVVSDQYYSSTSRLVTNVYYISCTMMEMANVARLDFTGARNCSYSFELEDDSSSSLCPDVYDGGLLWQQSKPKYVAKSCEDISERFAQDSYTYRQCSRRGRWSETDTKYCRLKPQYTQNGFINLWFELNGKEKFNDSSKDILIDYMNSLLVSSTSLNHSSITMQYVTRNGYLLHVGFIVILSSNLDHEVDRNASLALVSTLQDMEKLSIYDINNNNNKDIHVYQPTNSCLCVIDDEPGHIIPVCRGEFGYPCYCYTHYNNTCKCTYPGYVGNGVTCTVDSDYDGYPDIPLDSCNAATSNEKYCIQDNCPQVYNYLQTDLSCLVCTSERDKVWNITWSTTLLGATDYQYCPGSTNETAKRRCLSSGMWGRPQMSNCSGTSWFFSTLLSNTDMVIHSNATLNERLTDLDYLYHELVYSYSIPYKSKRGSPNTLKNINLMVNYTLELFSDLCQPHDINSTKLKSYYNLHPAIPSMLDVFDEMLHEEQVEGWRELEEHSGHSSGTTLLLKNIEEYFIYYTYAWQSAKIKKNYYDVSCQTYHWLSRDGGEWGGGADYVISSNLSESFITWHIPEALLKEKTGDGNQSVPIVSIQFLSLDDFLSSSDNSTSTDNDGDEDDYEILSNVWSGQIGESEGVGAVFSHPISITFSVMKPINGSYKYVCSYWNTSSGEWCTDGVHTMDTYEGTDNRTYVTCSAYHLTAFAILVGVNERTGQSTGASGSFLSSQKSMSIVSYVGCAASIFCLLLSCIFFASQYKELLEKPHMFIHLNLIIALLCAYTVFGLGIELANNSIVGCTLVAGLLHYFFLASFCWMLCEGVMLYLLLVVVFSKLSRKWYQFFVLGWVTPLIPVVIGVTVRYDNYVTKDENGKILYCWLSNDNGTIWAFVAPMILIITINVFFYAAIVWSLCKSKKLEKSNKVNGSTSFTQQVMSLLKGCIILLPLMGFTWLFGLLTIDTNTLIFAWLFTILNSTQGVAIFFLYVVRNDIVWSKLTFCFKKYIFKEVSYTKTKSSSLRIHASNTSLPRTNFYADNSSQDCGSSSPTSSGPPLDDASSTDTMLTRQVTLLRALDEDGEDNVSTMSIKIEFD